MFSKAPQTATKPNVQPKKPDFLSELAPGEMSEDADLVAAVEELEATMYKGSPAPSVPVPRLQDEGGSAIKATSPQEFPLFKSWRESLPDADHQWVSRAFFKWSASGKAEIDYARLDDVVASP